RKRDTLEQWSARFLEQHGKTLRPASRRQLELVFGRYVLPAWHGRLVDDIRRREVRQLVENIASNHVPMSNRVFAWLSKFFTWLCERDVIEASPAHGVRRPGREMARDRVLGNAEIKNLWLACDAVGGPGGSLVKVMLLLGQRRGEVSGMRRSEIEGDLW